MGKLDLSLKWSDACKLLQKYKKQLIASRSVSSDVIAKLTIVAPKNENMKKYKIVINDRYEDPIEADRTEPTWRLLFNVAEEGEVFEAKSPKQALDYLNSNKNCRLYSRTGYPIAKILKTENEAVVAAIPVEFINRA